MSEQIATVEGETVTLGAGRRAMIDDEERAVFAVVGDPAGDRYIQAPTDHDEMAALMLTVDTRGEHFFCSSRLGGCGEKVMPVNGNVRIPHFRHYAHTRCPLTPATNRDIYTHAIIQDALVCWLRRHGHPEARTEHVLDEKSRVDVKCEPGAVIEIQLSGETDSSMLARTIRYGNNVTWLYDPSNPISSRDATLARDGVVRLVRLRPETNNRPVGAQTDFSRQAIDIGTRTALSSTDPDLTAWSPLEACTFTPVDGLEPPAYAATKQAVAEARRMQREQAERAQRIVDEAERIAADARAAEDQERDRRLRAGMEANRVRHEQFLQGLADRRQQAAVEADARRAQNLSQSRTVADLGTRNGWFPIVYTVRDLARWEAQYQLEAPEHGAWRRVLEHHTGLFADWVGWMTDGWATGLLEHLIDPAWAALYLTTTSLSGQVRVFLGGGDLDVDPARPYDLIDPDGIILDRLVKLSLVTLEGESHDPRMVRVRHHLGQLRWNSRIRQPAAWPAAEQPVR